MFLRPVPDICAPIKSFLLQFPLAAELLERCRTLTFDLAPPPLPPLAQTTQELALLYQQGRQRFLSIASSFTRLRSSSQQPQQP